MESGRDEFSLQAQQLPFSKCFSCYRYSYRKGVANCTALCPSSLFLFSSLTLSLSLLVFSLSLLLVSFLCRHEKPHSAARRYKFFFIAARALLPRRLRVPARHSTFSSPFVYPFDTAIYPSALDTVAELTALRARSLGTLANNSDAVLCQ